MEPYLFVFYTFTNTGGNWTYGGLPGDWKRSSSGTANPIRGPRESRFDREESFYGSALTLEAARSYLQAMFTSLVNRGVIHEFLVTHHYRDGMQL